MSGDFDPMLPQMREELEEQRIQQTGGIFSEIRRRQSEAYYEKQEKYMKRKLQLSIIKRNRNRAKNKRARHARRKNR